MNERAKNVLAVFAAISICACGESAPFPNETIALVEGTTGPGTSSTPSVSVTDDGSAVPEDEAPGSAGMPGTAAGTIVSVPNFPVILAANGIMPAIAAYEQDLAGGEEAETAGSADVSAGSVVILPHGSLANVPLFGMNDIEAILPGPFLTLTSKDTPWLIGFGVTGGYIKYIDTETSIGAVQYNRKVDIAGEEVLCNAYVTGEAEGSPMNGDEPGKVYMAWCRKKASEGGGSSDLHHYIYWDYVGFEFDHFAFYDACVGNVVIDGSVKPNKKAVIMSYDKLGRIEGTYFFDGDLTYLVKNDVVKGSAVKFTGLAKSVAGEFDPNIDKFGLWGSISVGGKSYQLQKPDTMKDGNGVLINPEMPPPSAVEECWEKWPVNSD